MLPAGMAEKFLLGGLTSLRAIIYKGAEFINTMHSLSAEDAAAVIEYCKKRDEELGTERAEAQAAAQASAAQARAAAASASPEGVVTVGGEAAPAPETASAGATAAPADGKGGAQ